MDIKPILRMSITQHLLNFLSTLKVDLCPIPRPFWVINYLLIIQTPNKRVRMWSVSMYLLCVLSYTLLPVIQNSVTVMLWPFWSRCVLAVQNWSNTSLQSWHHAVNPFRCLSNAFISKIYSKYHKYFIGRLKINVGPNEKKVLIWSYSP